MNTSKIVCLPILAGSLLVAMAVRAETTSLPGLDISLQPAYSTGDPLSGKAPLSPADSQRNRLSLDVPAQVSEPLPVSLQPVLLAQANEGNQPLDQNPANVQNNPVEPISDPQAAFTLIPVGISVGGRDVVQSTLVRGLEVGGEAVQLEQWLVPFDVVVQALQLNVTPLEDGQLEIRSPGLVTRFDPNELQQDPELGQVLSVADIRNQFGVGVDFDLAEYAIQLDPPWLGAGRLGGLRPEEYPVITEGLPLVRAENATMTFVGQRISIAGDANSSTSYQGDFTSLGTLLEGSWFVRVNQPDLTNSNTWFLGEAQYLWQTDPADYVLGSQPTFWRSQANGGFWGATTIQRWGYDPSITTGAGGFSPATRLQADEVGRTIVGEASPGTLVQLTQGSRTNVIAEVLVDSSGVYRFEDVPQGGFYEVLLFPNGQLTAQPEIRDATFSTVPSQLPNGASALIASAGIRQVSTNSFFGEYDDVGGGVAYRRGVTEELTLGAGAIFDEYMLGLAELYYQPTNIPIQLAVSTLVGGEDEVTVDADFVYQPSNVFRLDINSDPVSSRFSTRWQVVPGLTLRTGGNTREDALSVGLDWFYTQDTFFAYAIADYNTNNDFRWNALTRYPPVEVSTRGNEISSDSEMLIRLSPGNSFTSGNFVRLGYETRNEPDFSDVVSVGWRYLSDERGPDGRYLWAIDAGYGFGTEGDGILASLSTAIVPGLVFQAIYEGVSTFSEDETFRIEVTPFVNTQAGVFPRDSRFEYLRQQGGLWVQPFLDKNANRLLDDDEEVFVDNTDLLLILNNQPIQRSVPEVFPNGVLLRAYPGIYRLDLDPAGYPLDWTPERPAYAVEVIAGSYTPVRIPFTLSYTVAGRVLDAAGQPVIGATVEAISADDMRTASVTNGAGIFYLESLQQGTYSLRINGMVATPATLELGADTESFQEITLQLP